MGGGREHGMAVMEAWVDEGAKRQLRTLATCDRDDGDHELRGGNNGGSELERGKMEMISDEMVVMGSKVVLSWLASVFADRAKGMATHLMMEGVSG